MKKVILLVLLIVILTMICYICGYIVGSSISDGRFTVFNNSAEFKEKHDEVQSGDLSENVLSETKYEENSDIILNGADNQTLNISDTTTESENLQEIVDEKFTGDLDTTISAKENESSIELITEIVSDTMTTTVIDALSDETTEKVTEITTKETTKLDIETTEKETSLETTEEATEVAAEETTKPNIETTEKVTSFETKDEVAEAMTAEVTDAEQDDAEETEVYIDSDVEVGDIITFGRYIQNAEQQSIMVEPIEWRVLKKSNGRSVVLISEYCIEVMEYKDKFKLRESVSWEESSIRKWLNNDFYNSAFTTTEQEKIIMQKDYKGTKDKVLLLSTYEAETKDDSEYYVLNYFNSSKDRLAKPTEYVRKKGIRVSDKNGGTCYWWLITPSWELGGEQCVAYVDDTGSVNGQGTHAGSQLGVRPVIEVRIST